MQSNARLPARDIALACLVIAVAGCHGADSFVPFGPGVIPAAMPANPLVIGGTTALRLGWAANTPEPQIRAAWRAVTPTIAVIDSVSTDTRTAYVRAVASGRAAIEYTAVAGTEQTSVGTIPIVVQ